MAKKASIVILLLVVVVGFSGCARGGGSFGDVVDSGWEHLEWHILGAYKDLVNMHEEIDKYIFNLDLRDPDRY